MRISSVGIDPGTEDDHCPAVHLEMRDAYTPDAPGFRGWLDGHRADPEDRASWWRPFYDHIAAAVARGVRVRRVRVVSEPVTDYIRYEHDVTYQNLAAGEMVRWLPRRLTVDLCLPPLDHWVFGDRVARVHHFAGDGTHIEDDLVHDRIIIKMYLEAFERAWDRATDHREFWI